MKESQEPVDHLPLRPPAPPALFGSAEQLAIQADGNFSEFARLLNTAGFVVVDYETTGLDAGNQPVQVAALLVKNGEVTNWLNLYMNPEEPLGEWSRANLRNRSGQPLTDAWLAKQLSISTVHAQLVEFIGDSIVVAHYLPFDAEVLESAVYAAGITWEMAGGLDTKGFVAAAVPPGPYAPSGYRLAQLTEFFDVPLGADHHDAMCDVVATHSMLQHALVYAQEHGDPKALNVAEQHRLFFAELRTYLARSHAKRTEPVGPALPA